MANAGITFARNRASESAGPSGTVGEGVLRQRGGTVVQQAHLEDSLLLSDSDALPRNDSLSLFAGLVPPPLRKSKKDFTSGKNTRVCHKVMKSQETEYVHKHVL